MMSVLFSCKKGSLSGGDQSTVPVSFLYHPHIPGIQSFELIVSNLDGSLILDTMELTDLHVRFSLRSRGQRVNVTVIHYDDASFQYTANSFLGVDPSKWNTVTDQVSYYSPVYAPPYTSATIHYLNAPTGDPYFINSSYPSGPVINPGSGTIDVSYARHSGVYNYLLIPSLGLYNFYMPKTDADTVDLSGMDTAVSMNFTKPSGYKLIFSNLNGYMDTSNFLNYLWLYCNPLIYSGYDLEYPQKMVQKYEFYGQWLSTNKDQNEYYSFSNSIPASIPFVDDSYFQLGSVDPDSFSVQFPGGNPSYYRTQWTSSNVTWNLYASPGTTLLHPMSFLTGLRSRLLHSADLSGLGHPAFSFELAQGLDYDGYLNYIFMPDQLNRKLLQSSERFSRFF
jgi:hypothetical protein